MTESGFAAATDGTRIAWRSRGSGAPVLLIAGQAVDQTAWDAIVPDLAEHFRVVTFDHRGVGASDAGGGDNWTTSTFADDAVSVLEHLGIDRAHVYGHSMGGRVAQQMALDYPDRVRSLVLGATSPGDLRGTRASREAIDDLLSNDPDRMSRQFFRNEQPHADAAAFFNLTAGRRSKRLHWAASRDHDTWDDLELIEAPTLILHGDRDLLTPPENAIAMADRIPGAQLIMYPGARHGYYLDEPSATADVIRFLSAVDAGDGSS